MLRWKKTRWVVIRFYTDPEYPEITEKIWGPYWDDSDELDHAMWTASRTYQLYPDGEDVYYRVENVYRCTNL